MEEDLCAYFFFTLSISVYMYSTTQYVVVFKQTSIFLASKQEKSCFYVIFDLQVIWRQRTLFSKYACFLPVKQAHKRILLIINT